MTKWTSMRTVDTSSVCTTLGVCMGGWVRPCAVTTWSLNFKRPKRVWSDSRGPEQVIRFMSCRPLRFWHGKNNMGFIPWPKAKLLYKFHWILELTELTSEIQHLQYNRETYLLCRGKRRNLFLPKRVKDCVIYIMHIINYEKSFYKRYMNYTCGSSQVIRKLSFFCLQVTNEVYIILSWPVQIYTNTKGIQ